MAASDRVAELLWNRPGRPQRGPKPAMSRDRIVAVGIALADADGLAALTMQRVAADLGFTKMSLYRYVPGRAELVALMLDAAMGVAPDLDPTVGWREGLRTFAMRMHTMGVAHPWVFEAATGGRVFGPNELGWLEAGLTTLADTGLTGGERLDTVALVVGHVRNIVAQGADSATPEQDIAAALGGVFAEHGERYPHAAAAFADAGRDRALEFGLDRILDGLAALVSRR